VILYGNNEMVFVGVEFEWNFYPFIRHNQLGAIAKNATRKRICDPAIPVQLSNQLSYRETVVEL
jgi:hypothetical protein